VTEIVAASKRRLSRRRYGSGKSEEPEDGSIEAWRPAQSLKDGAPATTESLAIKEKKRKLAKTCTENENVHSASKRSVANAATAAKSGESGNQRQPSSSKRQMKASENGGFRDQQSA